MPIRTDLNSAFRPSPVGEKPGAPSAPAEPAVSVDQLMQKVADGTITPTEAKQLAQLLESPELKDAFTPQQRKDLQKFAEGKGPPPRAPNELHGNLELVKNARELPARFAADLVLAHDALLEHAALLRSDKATRLFAFAVPYAQAIVETAQNPQELKAALNELLKQAEKAGFKSLERQPDGADGLKALRELFRAPNDMPQLAAAMKFDAPSWPKDAVHAPEAQQQLKVEAQTMRPPNPVLQPPVPIQQRPVGEAERSSEHLHDDGTNKKLSSRMLWNVLHRFRDAGEDEQDSAAQRDKMNQLMLVAALFLVFIAIVVGVLVAL